MLLWGYKSWLLRTSLLNKLEVFINRNARKILRISMFRVKDAKITTQQIREKLYNMPSAKDMIAARQMSFIGKVVRSPPQTPAHLMLTTYSSHKRRPGRSYFTNKDTLVKNLELLSERVEEVHVDPWQGSMVNWTTRQTTSNTGNNSPNIC